MNRQQKKAYAKPTASVVHFVTIGPLASSPMNGGHHGADDDEELNARAYEPIFKYSAWDDDMWE